MSRRWYRCLVAMALIATAIAGAPEVALARDIDPACIGDFETALKRFEAIKQEQMTPVDVFNAAWLRRMLGEPASLPSPPPQIDAELLGLCSDHWLAPRLSDLWRAFGSGRLPPEPLRLVTVDRNALPGGRPAGPKPADAAEPRPEARAPTGSPAGQLPTAPSPARFGAEASAPEPAAATRPPVSAPQDKNSAALPSDRTQPPRSPSARSSTQPPVGSPARQQSNSFGARDKLIPRVGAHESYDRVVIDWPEVVDYDVAASGREVTIKFGSNVEIEVGPIARRLGDRVAGLRAVVGPEETSIMFTLSSEVQLRHFRNGRSTVLDFVRGPATDPIDAASTGRLAKEKSSRMSAGIPAAQSRLAPLPSSSPQHTPSSRRGRALVSEVLLSTHETRALAERAADRAQTRLAPEFAARVVIEGSQAPFRVLLPDADPEYRCGALRAQGIKCSVFRRSRRASPE